MASHPSQLFAPSFQSSYINIKVRKNIMTPIKGKTA
jgi:hypothetical protein